MMGDGAVGFREGSLDVLDLPSGAATGCREAHRPPLPSGFGWSRWRRPAAGTPGRRDAGTDFRSCRGWTAADHRLGLPRGPSCKGSFEYRSRGPGGVSPSRPALFDDARCVVGPVELKVPAGGPVEPERTLRAVRVAPDPGPVGMTTMGRPPMCPRSTHRLGFDPAARAESGREARRRWTGGGRGGARAPGIGLDGPWGKTVEHRLAPRGDSGVRRGGRGLPGKRSPSAPSTSPPRGGGAWLTAPSRSRCNSERRYSGIEPGNLLTVIKPLSSNLSAPGKLGKGALDYPQPHPFSKKEALGLPSLGHPAYLRPKGTGDQSMAEKRGQVEIGEIGAPQDPHGMVKARLLES